MIVVEAWLAFLLLSRISLFPLPHPPQAPEYLPEKIATSVGNLKAMASCANLKIKPCSKIHEVKR